MGYFPFFIKKSVLFKEKGKFLAIVSLGAWKREKGAKNVETAGNTAVEKSV